MLLGVTDDRGRLSDERLSRLDVRLVLGNGNGSRSASLATVRSRLGILAKCTMSRLSSALFLP